LAGFAARELNYRHPKSGLQAALPLGMEGGFLRVEAAFWERECRFFFCPLFPEK